MTYNGKYYKVSNFSGGEKALGLAPDQASSPSYSAELPSNAASALSNIILMPNGAGFRNRYETVYNNSTEFGAADSYPVVGVGQLDLASGASYTLAIKKDKAYSSTTNVLSRAVSYTDRTGAVTISTTSTAFDRAYRRWSFCTFNDLLIGFGGSQVSTPDAPFKWAGAANNLVALGGSPPTARFCFTANNRVFAGATVAAPSTLYWSIIGNAEDWTGAGSGSAVVGSLADGDPILDAVVLGNDLALVFKSRSIYAVDLTAAPFVVRLLFNGVGCKGYGSVVVADGMAYFQTPSHQMKATDGNQVYDFPPFANNWLGTPASSGIAPPYVFGFRLKSLGEQYTAPYDMLVWCGYSGYGGTDTDTAVETIAWDLGNKCWVRFPTGFAFTSGAQLRGGGFFGGWTNQGRVFQPDCSYFNGTTLFKDDLTANSGNIACYWQSGWLTQGELDQLVKPDRFILHGNTLNGATYSSTLTYGYDFGSLSRSASLPLTSGSSGFMPRAFLTGRGNLFKFRLSFSPTTAVDLITVHSFTLGGKVAAQKVKAAS